MIGIHNSCGLCSIEMKNISVTSGEDTLLDNVNLTFHCGDLTALIGKNGAGKTTLLKTLLGERHYKGSISFTDHHGTVLPVPKIGYVPQHLDFDKSMPVSVADFIAAAKGGNAVWFGKNKKMKERFCFSCVYLHNYFKLKKCCNNYYDVIIYVYIICGFNYYVMCLSNLLVDFIMLYNHNSFLLVY